MRRSLFLIPWIVVPLFASSAIAQHQPHDPLTPDQAQKIAEASIDPPARVDLYTKFLNEHADAIKALAKRAPSKARGDQMSDDLEDFANLMDELSSNLDMYSERKADIRKALKPLGESVQRWQEILHALPTDDPSYNLSITDAVDSANDLADQTKQLVQDQDSYFKEHPTEKGQQRVEPPPQ
ncbi:MAG TPA: hypothetical protein VMA34_01275 [Terracidiphilus sp.]|nr:hypothetical protein [Terracidiphilus sp.]